MPRQLPADCLNEIFEYLEDDKPALYSCLLVNRLWCKVSVRILWRNIWNFRYSIAYQHRPKVSLKIISTLVACLPDESKELLNKNGVIIPTPTSESPLFNYASFCKVLSIYEICRIIDVDLDKIPSALLSLKSRNCLVVNEVIKMFTNQISVLKKLTYINNIYNINPNEISFTCFSEARDSLTYLTELNCSSDIPSEFIHQLSRICHNLQTLRIDFFENIDFNIIIELNELISLQNSLKNLNLSAFDGGDWIDILPSLTKHSNTLTKLQLNSDNDNLPLSFVASFPNLQEIEFSFSFGGAYFDDFEKLQYAIFPKLQILNIPYDCPKPEHVMNILKNNGKNLEEISFPKHNNDLNLIIAKFCPNLRKLFVLFNDDELDTLITIFNRCQHLESIKFWCGERFFLSEKEVLETVAKYSPKNFYELKIYNDSISKLLPEDLESFFISWKNRSPKKSLTLIIIRDYFVGFQVNEENMKIINKYKNLGIIRKFEIRD
ncbi:hypothetical protein C1645_876272 [Glomus cerebriforme]|uniref:F-box domain-containing protein n=1 Tax=Glomus cerebriforme TaxID=658196 RepID=A0A397SVY9_9GLOM|nr:hypothetical protein C1645_876272 [Glomus cerebriforme]